MTAVLTIADLLLALALFWHSANSPDRDAVLRTLAALHSAAPAALKPRYTPAPGLSP